MASAVIAVIRANYTGAMQVIGHRGAAGHAPENTYPSFDLALAMGADALETDVQQTSDGELVLIHDNRLERTTNGVGLVRETPWAIIESLDAGAWFNERYRGAKVPRLPEFLRRYGERTHLVLEIKRAKTALALLNMARELDLLDKVTFTSFKLKTVSRIRVNEPRAKIGFLAGDIESIEAVAAAGADQYCPPARMITPALVERCKGLRLEVRAWGVKNEPLMRAAIDAGVDGMTVDFPDVLLRALDRAPQTPQ